MPNAPAASPDAASIARASGLARLRHFVIALGRLLDDAPDEPRVLREGAVLLAALVAHDDWLPDAFAQPDA
ncbi:MAG: cysteine dioxygenase, partial [Comamonadaceae bacterium]